MSIRQIIQFYVLNGFSDLNVAAFYSGSAYDNDADDDDEAVATNSESDEMVSTSDERFRSSERQRTRTSTSNSRDGYPPPPVSGGRYIEVDSQSESSPGTNTKSFLPYLNNP